MSDYSNGRMSADAMADAQAALINDLAASGEPYCINCLRLEKHCECSKQEIYLGDKPIAEIQKENE